MTLQQDAGVLDAVLDNLVDVATQSLCPPCSTRCGTTQSLGEAKGGKAYPAEVADPAVGNAEGPETKSHERSEVGERSESGSPLASTRDKAMGGECPLFGQR